MSTSITGLRDWIVQRVSAVYMALYIILVFAYLAAHPNLQYATWQHLFTVFWFQIASLLFLIALVAHAWIGLWTIVMDYVKVSCLNSLAQLFFIFSLAVFLLWGVEIIWRIPLTWVF